MSAERTVKNLAVSEEAIISAADKLGIEDVETGRDEIAVAVESGMYGKVRFQKNDESGLFDVKYDSMYSEQAKRFINVVKAEDTVIKVAQYVNANTIASADYLAYYKEGQEVETEITY